MKLVLIKQYLRKKEFIRIIKFIVLSYFLFVFSIAGQNKNTLHFDLDFAQFRMDQKSVYVEIYYSVPRENISHERADKGFQGAFQIASQITKNDSLLLTDTLIVEDWIQSLEQISAGQKFAELSTFILTNGNYLIKSELIDLVSNKSVSISDSLTINLFSFDSLMLSSIEFASSIKTQKVNESKFDKNGLRVIPNAERIYGKDLPNLFFYAEAYNFAWSQPARTSHYQVSYRIKDVNGNAVLDLAGKEKKKPGKTSVIYGSLDVIELFSGSYVFEIEVKDLYNMQIARAEKRFFIYNKSDFMKESEMDKQVPHANIQKYNQMENDELDKYFKQLKYIADKDEMKVYKELGLEGKRNFIISFWSRRDPNPATPINEYEIQYNDLLIIANERYSNVFREGWETDRGRVLLLYGLPDTKDIVPTSTDTKAHEIWQYYHIEGGVKFVFVDKKQNGNYELVHSTKRGEISDTNWWLHHARL